jgi:maltose alpha-D-glucosyltransferase/alpha-amylase
MRLNLGIRRRLAPLLDNDPQRIALVNSLLFTLPGSPILYYGDEIGMGDNIELFDRNGVRTPMQWDDSLNAGFSMADSSKLYAPVIKAAPYAPSQVNVRAQQADSGSLYHLIRRLISLRKAHPAFSLGFFEWAEVGNNAVAAYWRAYQDERFLILNNLSSSPQSIHIALRDTSPSGQASQVLPAFSFTDIITAERFIPQPSGGLSITLQPLQFLWLT